MNLDPQKLIESGTLAGVVLFGIWYLRAGVDRLADRVGALHDKLIEFMARGGSR